MSIYHCTLHAKNDEYGWKYDWYLESDSAAGALETLVGDRGQESASDLMEAFENCHENTTIFYRLTAANVADRRDHQPRNMLVLGNVSAGEGPNQESRPDLAGATMVWRLFGKNGLVYRDLQLSGQPDSWFKRSAAGNPNLQAFVRDAVEELVSTMEAHSLLIYTQSPIVADTVTGEYSVIGLDATPNTNGAMTRVKYRSAAQRFALDDVVRFPRISRNSIYLAPYLNDNRVADIGDDGGAPATYHVDIEAQYAGPSGGISPTGLRMRGVAYVTTEIEEVPAFVGFASRKRGSVNRHSGRATSRSYKKKVAI